MKNLMPVVKYMGLFILVYGVLFGVFSMPSVAKFTADTYRTVTAPILQGVFPEAYLKLEEDAPPESDPYTIRAVFISQKRIAEAKAAAKNQGNKQVDLKAQEYDIYIHLLFTSFFLFLVSLILITPLSIRNKIVALLVGGLLFYAYTVLKIFIFLLDLFNRSSYDMYKLSETGGRIAESLSYVTKSLGMSAFIVVFIWILVAFRKSNWKNLLSKIGEGGNKK